MGNCSKLTDDTSTSLADMYSNRVIKLHVIIDGIFSYIGLECM